MPLEVITFLQTAANRRVTSSASFEPSARETEFVRFADGALADLVRDASGDLRFVVVRDGEVSFHRTLKSEDVTLVPPKIEPSILAGVCLPASVGASCTAAELLKDINQVLGDYVGLDPPDRKLAAYITLSSWVSDLLHAVPYLWIIGPPEYGKTTLVRLLSVLCRRGILAADISSAGLYSVIDRLRPTILIDDFDYAADSKTRDLLRLLRNGSTAGLRVYRATRAYQLFGPKIISSRQAPTDAVLKSCGLVVVARPSSVDLSVLTNNALETVQQRLQPKLLGFRLQNYPRLVDQNSRSLPSGLTPWTKEMFRALALPLMGDVELEHELLEILTPHNMEAVVDRQTEPEYFVMTALLTRVHLLHAGPNMVTVKELAEMTEHFLREAGEPYRLTARKVGAVLRSLGFRTQKLGNLGRGLRISKDLVLETHIKAKSFGICVGDMRSPRTLRFTGPTTCCRQCYELGLLFDNDGKELPYVEGEQVIPVPQDIDPLEYPDDPR
jgi:hypothetical protein